ncbi:hypothetical protein SFUMM280S_03194 [Streptomyces fumanus]
MLGNGGYDPAWRSFAWAAFAIAMITDLFDGHLARTYNLDRLGSRRPSPTRRDGGGRSVSAGVGEPWGDREAGPEVGSR